MIKSIISPALLVLSLAACGSVVDTDGLTPIDDYDTWDRVDAVGPVGGHGDSYRVMYANPIAREYGGTGLYAAGSVILKEVRDIGAGDTMGDLRYIAIMRKLEDAPSGGSLDGTGWLFTTQSDAGADETNSARCWKTCHQAATLDGTFLDWSY